MKPKKRAIHLVAESRPEIASGRDAGKLKQAVVSGRGQSLLLIVAITFSYILIVIMVVFGSSLLIRRLPDSGQGSLEREVPVYFGHAVSQSIKPLNNGFNVVVVYMKNISLRNQEPLQFSLKNSSGDTIRIISLTGYNIGDGDNVRFQFEPILDSAEKTYTFTLSSDSSVLTNAIGAGITSKDAYPGGSAVVGNIQGGDLAFELFYFPVSRIDVLKNVAISLVMSLLQPRFLILFALIGVGIYWFASILVKKSYVQN